MTAVTLGEVEALAMQLPATERLKLAARLCEQVGSTLPEAGRQSSEEAERKRDEALRLADQLLAECADIQDDSLGTTDAVELLRQQRDERMAAVCPRSA